MSVTPVLELRGQSSKKSTKASGVAANKVSYCSWRYIFFWRFGFSMEPRKKNLYEHDVGRAGKGGLYAQCGSDMNTGSDRESLKSKTCELTRVSFSF